MTTLPDQADRDRARDRRTETVFVTAGAGAGKTKVLVDRICGLVTDPLDPIPIGAIAAVTFTEKAAAEMRDRVRAELSRRARTGDPAASRLAVAALEDLDLAAIGTLHSFASRLLMENPIEAALPPVLHPLDEVASSARSERWWADLRGRLIDEEATSQAMQVLMALGTRLDAIRGLAFRLQGDWDLVEDRCPTDGPTALRALDLAALDDAHEALLARARGECTNVADRLYAYLDGMLREWWAQVQAAADDLERLPLLCSAPKPGNAGVRRNWVDVQGMKAEVKAFFDEVRSTHAAHAQAALEVVVAAVAADVLREADSRRREGALQFQDLLVLARRMLRRSEQARMAAHRRYRRILLDEFQDTDPLQIEIAVRIAAGVDGGRDRWQDCPVPDGSLFVVGDAKQSIYRFRRANITTFLEAQEALAGQGSAVLTTNFRSHPGVLDWVNHVFGRLIVAEPGGQPEYRPLQPAPDRLAMHRGDAGHRVLVLGADALGTDLKSPELRAHEARQVASAIAHMLRFAPPVEERARIDGVERWTSRPLRAADVCVLVPARTSLAELEAQLDAFGVRYRTEASSLVYRSDEVRDLLLAARAIDDPTDELALVEALRTPLFGCGDDDLVEWRAAGGRFRVFGRTPEEIAEAHPVAEAIGYLSGLSRMRSTMSPSELLATLIADRRLMELATDGPRYREAWRRLRFVVDQARAWSEAERGSLRDYLAWAGRQAEEEEKANEVVLPERDVDAIRILTVHAAKGLEFPVVVLSGMTSAPRRDVGGVVWPEIGPPEVCVTGASTAGWEAARDRESRLLHLETLRLLYVAATRAESRLVVSMVRAGRPNGLPADPRVWTRAELLAGAAGAAPHDVWSKDPDEVAPLESEQAPVDAPMPWEDFVALRDRAVSSGGRREADSATDIAHRVVPTPVGLELPAGLLKEPRDLELPAWMKGRYGAAVGRAVHATLQTVDLVTGEGLDGIAEVQALAESVADRLVAVRALAHAGWAAPTVRSAASREHHKEMYVGAIIGGQLVEGYIDLLYRDDDGSLVVVDYKTDANPSDETVQAYRAQLAVYARALAEATGEHVSRGVLVFCREDGAVEREVVLGGSTRVVGLAQDG